MAAQAGTIAETIEQYGNYRKLRLAWTSATGGAWTGTTANKYSGKIIGLMTNPGATAPTDNYDIVATDKDGDDVLLGAGMNRDTSNTEYVASASLGMVVDSALTITIADAGDAKLGELAIYIQK